MYSAPDVCIELFLNLQSSPSNFKDTEYWVSQYSPIGTVAKKKKKKRCLSLNKGLQNLLELEVIGAFFSKLCFG